jgi:hypothetical protein
LLRTKQIILEIDYLGTSLAAADSVMFFADPSAIENPIQQSGKGIPGTACCIAGN